MAESVVERSERETSSPTARICARLALRGLVVAGFACGIWLLSGSAAQAADARGAGAPDSTEAVTNLVTDLGGHGVDDILGPGSSRATASAVRAGRHRSPSGHAVRLLGLGDGSAVDPVARLLTPVTGVVRGSLGATGIALTRLTHLAAGGRPGDVSRAPSAGTPAVGRHDTTASKADLAAAQLVGGPVQHLDGGRHGCRCVPGADRHPVRSVYRADRIGSRHGPVQPHRAPLPAHPDLGLAGTSTNGSSSYQSGGGGSAVVPATVAGAPGANRRAIPAGDVRVDRLTAEAPTVSPD